MNLSLCLLFVGLSRCVALLWSRRKKLGKILIRHLFVGAVKWTTIVVCQICFKLGANFTEKKCPPLYSSRFAIIISTKQTSNVFERFSLQKCSRFLQFALSFWIIFSSSDLRKKIDSHPNLKERERAFIWLPFDRLLEWLAICHQNKALSPPGRLLIDPSRLFSCLWPDPVWSDLSPPIRRLTSANLTNCCSLNRRRPANSGSLPLW